MSGKGGVGQEIMESPTISPSLVKLSNQVLSYGSWAAAEVLMDWVSYLLCPWIGFNVMFNMSYLENFCKVYVIMPSHNQA